MKTDIPSLVISNMKVECITQTVLLFVCVCVWTNNFIAITELSLFTLMSFLNLAIHYFDSSSTCFQNGDKRISHRCMDYTWFFLGKKFWVEYLSFCQGVLRFLLTPFLFLKVKTSHVDSMEFMPNADSHLGWTYLEFYSAKLFLLEISPKICFIT